MHPELAEASPTLAVGEWHLKAHIPTCQDTYSARLKEGTGLMFGDSIEHLWADLRKHGHLTKRMTKAARQDKLTLLVFSAVPSCSTIEGISTTHPCLPLLMSVEYVAHV